MSQVTNYAVPNGPRADVRQGINAVLAALRDANAGATEPPNPVPHMLWLDTSGADSVVKIRNPANTGWRFLDEVIGMSALGLSIANAADTPAVRTILGLAVYTQAVAEAGTSSGTGLMSPLRAAQLITARHANSAVIETNGAAVYDVTGIPSWARKITVMMNGVQTNGTTDLKFVQLGDAGGIETTGYNSGAFNGTGSGQGTSITTGFLVSTPNTAGPGWTLSGAITFTLMDAATNLWVGEGSVHCPEYGVGCSFAGAKALSASLDRIRLSNTSPTNFTGGTMAIRWEV